ALACGDGNDAPVEIARLAVGAAAASSAGEVRVPAPPLVPGAGAYSVLCLLDPEAGDAGRDRAALRHIAHDLRSPLTTMLTLIEERSARLHERPGNPAGEDLSFLEELRRQADYSLRLSRDFLQISRAERLDRGSFVPVNLEDVVAEAVDQMWLAAEQRSIRLVGPVGHVRDPWIQGNPAMLVRALANLLDNALKYSGPDTEVAAWVRRAEDGRLLLRVIDQGVGIDEADLPHLFDPFFQAGGAAGAMRGGANMGVGLGLAFVRCVVERHGGEISVASRVGHGTEVSIFLPAG
ncbi:sensor histidine kinase, partial [Pseudoxanthomonas taiwanensis]